MKTLGRFQAGPPSRDVIDPIVRRALEEDHAFDDRSTLPLPGAGDSKSARVLAREGGVLAGRDAFARAFELLADDEAVEIMGRKDGDSFAAGEVVLELRASARVLLGGERTGLNFLQRLSGVATVTRRCVDAAGGRIAICDTRKTTPGLRALEKWAVVAGGGTSHRWSLGDMVMLKENHLALAGGIAMALGAIYSDERSGSLPVTVEVRTFDEAIRAAEYGAHRLLLDNMSNDEMARIVARLAESEKRPELEASGNVTLARIPELARIGVDCVSLGALTHSVKAIDFSFLIEGA
ncbi:MAG: carboxylating nicotinate-nucleotide diphosphorylase [bacterium]